MNTLDVLRYGHQTVLRALDGLPDDAWETPGACGAWSSKDIVAHLASFERVLVEVLENLLGGGESTPLLDRFRMGPGFNDQEVEARRSQSAAEVLAEYQEAHDEAMALAERLPPKMFRQVGILPWYGAEYDLDDFLVYTFYGHKREHAAQIKLVCKRLAG
jgi:uncharacterized protein (TIGR03083 family)